VKLHGKTRFLTEGKGEHTGGHPILPLVWLANARRLRGDGLAAGLLVSTSSTTGGYRAPPDAEVTAEYVTGKVRLTFTPPAS
jgi:2-keto-4-pentenoate hydratase